MEEEEEEETTSRTPVRTMANSGEVPTGPSFARAGFAPSPAERAGVETPRGPKAAGNHVHQGAGTARPLYVRLRDGRAEPRPLRRPPLVAAASAQPSATFAQVWRLFDARGKVLGRLASEISTVLMGKHKPIYHPAGTGAR